MRSSNSLQRKQPPIRGIPPHILVSYHRAIMSREEYAIVSRLITGLQSIGIHVTVDELQDMQIPPGVRLHAYDWISLVETKNDSSAAFVEERLARALSRDGRPHQGILHIRVSKADKQKMLPDMDSMTFDVGIDYARAFAGIVLKIYPDYRTRLYGVERGATALKNTTTNSFSGVFTGGSSPTNQRQSLAILSIILVALIVLGAIVTHSFAFSSSKMTTTQPTHPHSNKPIITKATPPQALYTLMTSHTPVINDSLQSQSANQWDVTQQQGISCAFTNGAYHVSILPPSQGSKRNICLAQRPVFANFAMQVDIQLLQGDVGGMVFHADGINAYSWFALDARGCYRLVHVTADGQAHILSQDCPAIPILKTNQLTVIARDGNIYLYINGKFMRMMADKSIMKGGIGLVAIERTQPTDVAFNNLKVWQ